MWLIAANQLVLALTRSLKLFYASMGVTLGGYVVVSTIVERRKKRRAETKMPVA
jgi:hypothetical protein